MGLSFTMHSRGVIDVVTINSGAFMVRVYVSTL